MSALRRVWQRVSGLVARAIVTGTDTAGAVQLVTARNAADVVTLEAVEPYGLTAAPIGGAEAVVVAPGGDVSEGFIVQIGDRRYRPRNLPAGDVCIYSANGNRVWLRDSGVTVVVLSGSLTVQGLPTGPDAGTIGEIVHGRGIDPFTGATYDALGNTTAQLRAEKV